MLRDIAIGAAGFVRSLFALHRIYERKAAYVRHRLPN